MPAAVAKTFPKNCRIRTAAEYKRVYDKGIKRTSRSFALFALRNGLEQSRFGLTTPRRLGKAHCRNRIKRRVREILRTTQAMIPPGFDFVVNPKGQAMDRNFEELRSELMGLLSGER